MTGWECGLCMVSSGRDRFIDTRENVRKHLIDHGLFDDSIETYLTKRTGSQETLAGRKA